MSPKVPAYNERSWAIDLIAHIKHIVRDTHRVIRDAGGEHTVSTDDGSLFPDVLLFGDLETARILQGWELKMPDTDIDNVAFRQNAESKARSLGLDSFLLWNVQTARLFVRDEDADAFELAREWDQLGDITTRAQVRANAARWQALVEDIVSTLNELFETGALEGRAFIDAYESGGITGLILENSGEVADVLERAARQNAELRAEITLWWDRYSREYDGASMMHVLARAILSNWIGKILFAHILRERDQRASQVAEIGAETTPLVALDIFRQLSESCNFWTIFSDSVGLECLSARSWAQLKEFNNLLCDLRVGSIQQAQLSGVLESTVEVAIRKLRGQFPTPIELARLLVRLCIRNIEDDRVLDPCCGSGTIARAALELKIDNRVDAGTAARTVFAGDLDPQAVQIATFAMAKPSLMNVPLRIFRRDALALQPDAEIALRDPRNGAPFSERLGSFEAITTNLPFVSQEGRARYGNALQRIAGEMQLRHGIQITGRADVAAYFPFALRPLLTNGGRLGIIITNAWLGTDWGDDFFDLVNLDFRIRCVITSGAGRWFRNSDVVTNVLVLERREDLPCDADEVKFVVLTRPLEEIADEESVAIAAAQIELGQTQNDTMTINSVTIAELRRFKTLGLGGNAQFVNCAWALTLPLVSLSSLFIVRRGERRGLNALFYPEPGHGIEAEYIRPLVKSPTEFSRLTAAARREAFCCSMSEPELEDLGHVGALRWIRNFETPANVEKLGRGVGRHWYEMSADSLSELVMFINYGARLFVGRVTPPAFVDQRLVSITPIEEQDIGLCHALLNCTISMFLIEGMGFGRGLGALDLNKDRIEDCLHILDPRILSADSIRRIKAAFAPLLERDVMEVADELEQADRRGFDEVVVNEFGLDVEMSDVYDSLLQLVGIREAAID